MVTAIHITSSDEEAEEAPLVVATAISPSETAADTVTNPTHHQISERSQLLQHPSVCKRAHHPEEDSADDGLGDRHSSHGNKKEGKKRPYIKKSTTSTDIRQQHKHLLPYQPNRKHLLLHPAARKRAQHSKEDTADEGLYDEDLTHGNNDHNYSDEEEEKLDVPLIRKRNGLVLIDLSDVPPQPPILKTSGHTNRGASKYAGVSFNKERNIWSTQIRIEEKQQYIGAYDNELDAAIDYARAVLKYKGKEALEKERACRKRLVIDLTDVPPQPPIPKSAGNMKEGASKYTGVTFHKARGKWNAKIKINGKRSFIGYYDSEEEAAVDYARALYKYRGQGVLARTREKRALETFDEEKAKQQMSYVSSQPPIPKVAGQIGLRDAPSQPYIPKVAFPTGLRDVPSQTTSLVSPGSRDVSSETTTSLVSPNPQPQSAGQIEEGAILLVSLSTKRRKVEDDN